MSKNEKFLADWLSKLLRKNFNEGISKQSPFDCFLNLKIDILEKLSDDHNFGQNSPHWMVIGSIADSLP